jgi:glycosyltransferase involved in cell wall biosynthesis
MLTTDASPSAIQVHGKFLSKSGSKFFFKAMRLDDVGSTLDFDAKLKLRRRMEALKGAHTTGLILTQANAQPALDIAAQAGLFAIIELSASTEEIIDRRKWRTVLSRFSHEANVLGSHPALAGFLISCPITADWIRAHGVDLVRMRLGQALEVLEHGAPDKIRSIKIRPETRALSMFEEDVIFAEVPALEPLELHDFITSIHIVAENRPVIIEFAAASPGQDEAVAMAFGTGAAGVVAPAVPAPASATSLNVRMLQAADLMPFVSLNGTCPPKPASVPMVSVVICAYNAERTMRQCLESLRKLDYPNFEVVIVDDGSRDNTAAISMDFPEFRLVRQPNKGLSFARNVGMQAARGEIIAYTDSDCVVDPHWLTLMARAMEQGGFDGCGGPNLSPHEDGRIEACCSASPGAPCHVLVGDTRAEHLAGCNMVFARAALEKVGGFDAQFTTAGDDVDVCWRMIDAGLKIGFCASAFVWHFRRNTIKAYYGQQRGYGRAEAMLYARYPARFNSLGQIAWRGTIPGLARTYPGGGRKRMFWGAATLGTQRVFDPALTMARVIPQTMEWTAGWTVALVASILLGWSAIPAAAMLALGPMWALYYGWHAPLEKCHQSFSSRMLIAYLAYTGSMVRATTRYKTRARILAGLDSEQMIRQRPTVSLARRSVRLNYWNEEYVSRDSILDRMFKLFARGRHAAIIDLGWNDYDFEVRPGAWTRIEIKSADEEHGGMRLKNLVEARVRCSRLSKIALALGAAAAVIAAIAGASELALALAAMSAAGAVALISEMIESGRLAYRAIESAASELNLSPLGKPVAALAPARGREMMSGERATD